MYQRPRRGLEVRLTSIGVLFLVAWAIVGYRLTIVQGSAAAEFSARGFDQRLREQTLAAHRGTVFDSDGRPLAMTVGAVTIVADPAEMADPNGVADRLAPLVGADPATLRSAFATDSRFVYVVRQVDEAVAGPVREADLPGIHLLEEPRRVYPLGSLVSHVVGFVQADDNSGLEGIELQYDTDLGGRPGELVVERDPQGRVIPLGNYHVVPAIPGNDLVLTVRSEIQFAAHRALAAAVERTGAVAGSVIVLDPATGEVLAMVNYPEYDPNDRSTLVGEALRNRAITDVFEPGSTQKIVTIAAAVETGAVYAGTAFDIPRSLQRHDTVFRDVTPHSGRLSVTEIVTYSSNLGTILIGEQLGPQVLHSYLAAFGAGRATGIDYPGEPSGLLRPPQEWCVTTCLAGTAIGYRVSVTPLQMAMVYAAIANDGVWVQPHLVREVVDESGSRIPFEPAERRAVSTETARMMRSMLEAVVAEGTGSLAAVPGYRVGGKTGTTERYDIERQRYSEDDVVASFIGMAPIDAPRIVVAVVLDSPVHDASGGRGAAPVFAEVTYAALNQLGVPPDGG
jgi:cell division protein FtsI (penicillin-binding protein 3)